jgi:hypothetical protein
MKASLAAALLAFAFVGSALAQGQGSAPPPAAPTMNFKQACSADVQRLCATAQTRQDQHKCIKQNKAQLSPSCSSFLAEKHEEKMQKKQQQGAVPAQTSPSDTPSH